MANTEIKNTLKRIRKAQNAVTNALDKSRLTQPQRDLLDELSDLFRDIDNTLLMTELNKSLDKLQEKNKKLKALNKRTQNKLEGLKKVAKAVDVAAKGVDALLKAVDILVKAGIA